MSGRSTCHLAFYYGREGYDPAQVLVFRLPQVPDESAMHDRPIPAHCALGARAGFGGNAGSLGPNARDVPTAPTNRRASIRHTQIVDGLDAFPHQDTAARRYGNELACA